MRGKTNPKEKLALRDEIYDITTDREKMASILNNQFKSVFREYDISTLPDFSKRTQAFFEIENIAKKINQSFFSSGLGKLDRNKSTGFDGVYQMVLKNCSVSMALPLTVILLKSLQERKVPNQAW